MSSDIVIRVENLSKKYTLGHRPNGPDSGLRHALQNAATAPWRMWKNRAPKSEISAFNFPLSALPPGPRPTPSTSNFQLSPFSSAPDDFWALKDVSFEVRRGEVLGIIGRNGAGKSTLLKILSRITEPTSGRIGLKGRVASLLEVGTGFHPELSGRENIFLNGAILGMTSAEVKRKFDEIVAFAGVEKFLDTPVKHYSSGMYVRLAFAVAAHLEPEILVIDEVLAVGDAEFQKKCLGKMQDVASGGKTVLFVSHNLSAVRGMCDHALLLDNGFLVFHGDVEAAVQRYSTRSTQITVRDSRRDFSAKSRNIISITPELDSFAARQQLRLQVRVSKAKDACFCHFSIHIYNDSRENILTVSTEHLEGGTLAPDITSFIVRIDSPWLLPGTYEIDAYLYSGDIIDKWEHACRFEVTESLSRLGYSAVSSRGCRVVLADFHLDSVEHSHD